MQAVLLAAGLGSRLGELTATLLGRLRREAILRPGGISAHDLVAWCRELEQPQPA